MQSFQDRVSGFYAQFAKQEAELRAQMDRGDLQQATAELQQLLAPVLGDLPFQLYKKEGAQYLLECNTLLDSSKKILCYYFCDELPQRFREHWQFYYYHPALCGSLTLEGRTFLPADFELVPTVQQKTHRIDLKVLRTAVFDGMSDEDAFAVLYMMLTDHLGEIAAEAYIGRLSFQKPQSAFSKNPQTITLQKLRSFLNRTIQSEGWVEISGIQLIADSFYLKNKQKELRQDMTSGLSYSLDLLNEEELPADQREKTQYVKSCGVRYVSMVLPCAGKPQPACKKEKEAFEKKLSDIFAKGHSGAIVTSAFGNTNSYLDFFVYDEAAYQKVANLTAAASPPVALVDLTAEQAAQEN